ncbi:MAG TPA: hypothetical protein VEF06_15220 [Bryobacteraceae bacterium]|nr:hypothetical protein [Bryobacteraceae bacterium]
MTRILNFEIRMPISKVLTKAALLASVILLAAVIKGIPDHLHAWLSSAPLALAGLGYAVLQFIIRPDRTTLLKRLMLAATFVAWAVDQLLPPGPAATILGDFVIGAYVLDLSWIIEEQTALQPTRPPRPPADARA